MIQRIQTVFLALIVLLFVLFFFIPVLEFSFVNDDAESRMIPLTQMPLLLAGEVLIALIAFVTIFLYKTRKRQAKIAQFGMLLSLLLFAGVAAMPKMISADHDTTHVILQGIGTWFLLANPVLFFLAARSIKKDEELVRSADRLR